MPYADSITSSRVQLNVTSQTDRLIEGLGDKLVHIIRRERNRLTPSVGNDALKTLDQQRLVMDIRTSLMDAGSAVYDLVIGLKDREAELVLKKADASLPSDLQRYITEYLTKELCCAVTPEAYDAQAAGALEKEKAMVSAKLKGVNPEKSMIEKAVSWLKKLKGQEASAMGFGQQLLEALDGLMDQAVSEAVEKTSASGKNAPRAMRI